MTGLPASASGVVLNAFNAPLTLESAPIPEPEPGAVIAQIEGSERLERLHRRVCRPLDKPMLGGAAEDETATDGGDAAALEQDSDGDDAVRGL